MVGKEYSPPSGDSYLLWFGTDMFGRSVFYKVIHGTRILLSEATRAAAGEAYEYRFVGEATLRGKSETLRIFTLAG